MREDVKMSRCERRCEDEKMFYRPPLLEEPCAQTLSGTSRKIMKHHLEFAGSIINAMLLQTFGVNTMHEILVPVESAAPCI